MNQSVPWVSCNLNLLLRLRLGLERLLETHHIALLLGQGEHVVRELVPLSAGLGVSLSADASQLLAYQKLWAFRGLRHGAPLPHSPR